MKKKTIFILAVFMLILALFGTGCTSTALCEGTGGRIGCGDSTEDQIPADTADVDETEVETPEDTGDTFEADTGDESKTVTVEDGECEGLHDYQLPDLTELSSDDGLLIHVQFGRGGMEYETLFPTGRYIILKPFKFGHVWELGTSCSAEQALTQHVGPSIARRIEREVDSGGYVHWTTLVEDGTLEVVWQQEPVQEIPMTLPEAVETSISEDDAGDGVVVNVSLGFIGRDGDADNRTIGDDEFAYLVECWEPVDGICVVPIGESVSGLKGANWQFGSTESALADAQTKGKTIYVVEGGELVPLD